ncbi:MAG TPA: ZIP family metal transporter [Oxalicibacterium sp.]|jgi:ZIP family zinc transporter|nr:ZIP family metal transporter [Oxalicibacterium sp.]
MQVTDQNASQAFHTFLKKMTWRRAVGLVICLLGCALLLNDVLEQIGSNPNMRAALLGGGTAALATALGTLPVLFSQKFSQRTYDGFLGFGAGVMLAATAFSLVIPALTIAKGQGAGPWGASAIVGGGILLGTALLLLLDRSTEGNNLAPAIDESVIYANSLRRAWLFVLAVALHNLPEGLAIGVAYAGVDMDKANMLATGISIQDVPEGLVVALALRSVGYNRLISVGLGVVSGLIEPLAAVGGVAVIGMSAYLLPWGLAAAAGAMLFVICRDVIPEAHRNGNGTSACLSLVCGFILMTVLDTALA